MDPEPDAPEGAYTYCPKCGSPQEVHPVTTFRPGEDALGLLFRGQVNRAVCTDCESPFLVDVPLVFRDDEDRYLVYFIPLDDPGAWEEAEEQMRELTDKVFGAGDFDEDFDPPTCRLTVTRNSFIEKISLHLHGLDDRVVEYIKYQLYRHPDETRRVDAVRNDLRYDFSADDPDVLAFLVLDRESGRATGAVHLPMDLYREMTDTFVSPALDNELAALFPGFLVSVERLI